MSKCLLTGHTPIQREGVGDYAGKQYLVCSECAVTLGEVAVIQPEEVRKGHDGTLTATYSVPDSVRYIRPAWPSMREYEA